MKYMRKINLIFILLTVVSVLGSNSVVYAQTPPNTVSGTTSSKTTTTTTTTTKDTLSCNTFSITQNGASVSSISSTSPLSIQSGITSSSGSQINYSNALWSVNTGTISPSSSKSSAQWTAPSNLSNGTTLTISLSGVTDSTGATLSSPCSVTLNISTAVLANTGFDLPTYVVFYTGLFFVLSGLIYYIFSSDQIMVLEFRRRIKRRSKA